MIDTYNLFGAIERAIEIWREKIPDNADYVLLLPDNDARINNRLCAAFTAKLDNRFGVIIEGHDASVLLALYSLYAFTDKLIIGSFSEPHGRKLHNLLNSGMAAEDVLINDVILGAM